MHPDGTVVAPVPERKELAIQTLVPGKEAGSAMAPLSRVDAFAKAPVKLDLLTQAHRARNNTNLR